MAKKHKEVENQYMKVKLLARFHFFPKAGLGVDQHPMEHHNMDGAFSKSKICVFSIHPIIPIHYALEALLLRTIESDLY